jgi:hypothetical protein
LACPSGQEIALGALVRACLRPHIMVESKTCRVSGPGRGGAQAAPILPVRFRVACPLSVQLPVHGRASESLRSDPERTGARRRPGRREPRREYNLRLSERQLVFGTDCRVRAGDAARIASLVPYGTRPRDHTGREEPETPGLVLYSRSVSTIDLLLRRNLSPGWSRPSAHRAPVRAGRAVTLAAWLQADLVDGVNRLGIRELPAVGAVHLVDQPLPAEPLPVSHVALGRVERLLLGRGGPGGRQVG